MKTIRIVLIFATLIFTACAPVYVPNVRNAPLFRGAGEFQGSIHFGDRFDAQAAVSITDHVGIMGNYEYVSRNTSDVDDDGYVKHKLIEGGIGYYENADKFCYEIFAGYGKGEGTSFGDFSLFGFTDINATGTYNRFFVQPSIGSNHHIFNWIATMRLSVVDFEKFVYDNQVVQYSDPSVFFEPSFTGRVFFGESPIYSQFQAGFSFITQETTVYDYEPFNLSIGFGVRLGGKPKVSDQ